MFVSRDTLTLLLDSLPDVSCDLSLRCIAGSTTPFNDIEPGRFGSQFSSNLMSGLKGFEIKK